jgi:Ca2+-binding RTX toxin-like protein
MYGGPGRDSFGGYLKTQNTGRTPTILGGPGNDLISFSNFPSMIDGGPGGDTLDITAITFFSLDLNEISSVENVIGIRSLDVVIGTPTDNYFQAKNQDGSNSFVGFTVRSNGGDDTIVGGSGRDSLIGGDGDDIISGGGGNDTIYGGNGNDIINGNSGNDRIYGGAGNDTLIGGPGRDHLYGEAGDDYFSTRDNKIDTLYGGDGNDSAKIDNTSTVKDLYHEIETLV